MMIAGLEKHAELKGYIDKIERRKIERETDDIKLQLGLCTEYIVEQYLKEYPLYVGENLYSNIVNLEVVLSKETADLLHSLRKARNDGGAHRNEVEKYTFEETMGLYNELLNYLPEFLNKFPTPSEKPAPKAGATIGLGFKIDFESIQPLELHPNWRNCIGYQDMLKLKALPEYNNEFFDWVLNADFDACDEIYQWLWCIELIDKLNLIIKKDGKEYLNIQALVKYYYDILGNIVRRNPTENCSSSRYVYRDVDYYTDSCEIPGIIQKYFPGSVACFIPGKGFKWLPYFTEEINNEIDALVNGKEAGFLKEQIKDQVHWYTIGRAEEEERERRAAAYQAKKWEEAQRAKEAAREEKIRKEAAERAAKRREAEAKEKQKKVMKVVKGIALLYAFFIVLGIVMIVLQHLGSAKWGGRLLLFAVVAFFVIRKKKKNKEE